MRTCFQTDGVLLEYYVKLSRRQVRGNLNTMPIYARLVDDYNNIMCLCDVFVRQPNL